MGSEKWLAFLLQDPYERLLAFRTYQSVLVNILQAPRRAVDDRARSQAEDVGDIVQGIGGVWMIEIAHDTAGWMVSPSMMYLHQC